MFWPSCIHTVPTSTKKQRIARWKQKNKKHNRKVRRNKLENHIWGYKKININTIKEIREKFLQAITFGFRGGSGKVVLDFTMISFKLGVAHQWQNHCDVVQARRVLILLKMKVIEVMTMTTLEKKKVETGIGIESRNKYLYSVSDWK